MIPDQREQVLEGVKKLLEGSGLAVLGAIPYSPTLGSVRLNEVFVPLSSCKLLTPQ